MRKESRLNRAAGATAAVVLMASGMVVAGAPTASADNCGGLGDYFCGAVKNRTGRAMNYTTNLGDGNGRCYVWNIDGGTASHPDTLPCDQKSIGNGIVGGNGTGVDVDAFTFNGWGYHERFSRTGTWHWRTAGTWTKLWSGEFADCSIGDYNEIWCTRLMQI
ncbi:hypothetical protein [Streptomyces sp. NBC_00887]|uniref:hypothetical protein n=1 Tax=Streptomyces sp. NBC_00887 TaxID=2975859 RepID=UPI003866FAF4|nr:hypothetical protein OG844_01805 [Streptomyces sp. NBC_00887]WSY36120.1 hypothetical protein OG844_43800 [Streptomyces sp. NBC_00887]